MPASGKAAGTPLLHKTPYPLPPIPYPLPSTNSQLSTPNSQLTMIILPAIDLKGGKCVRLRQGREDDVTVYGDKPAAQAAETAPQKADSLPMYSF